MVTTAKYAKYAKAESFRGKGLDFSRVSHISRFKEFFRRGFGNDLGINFLPAMIIAVGECFVINEGKGG